MSFLNFSFFFGNVCFRHHIKITIKKTQHKFTIIIWKIIYFSTSGFSTRVGFGGYFNRKSISISSSFLSIGFVIHKRLVDSIISLTGFRVRWSGVRAIILKRYTKDFRNLHPRLWTYELNNIHLGPQQDKL